MNIDKLLFRKSAEYDVVLEKPRIKDYISLFITNVQRYIGRHKNLWFVINYFIKTENDMENQKKVGCVVIMHPGQNNYGSSLQGYATIYKIEKLGYDYEIIRYIKKRSKRNFSKIYLTF